MASVVQIINLYEKILELLKPLGRIYRNGYGRLGEADVGFLPGFGDLGLDNMRSDGVRSGNLNGRFYYTGLGSGQRLGGYVPEKIRGNWFIRDVDGVLGVGNVRGIESLYDTGGMRAVGDIGGSREVRGFGGVLGVDSADGGRGVLGIDNIGGVNNVSGGGIFDVNSVGDASDISGLRDIRNARSNWSAWNVGNDWNRDKESTSYAPAAANAISAANTVSELNALGYREYRLGEILEKQLIGKQILGTDNLASIDRSMEITGRGVFGTRGFGELWGDRNGFSPKIKTGGSWGTQSAFSENKRSGELEKMRNAVSEKTANDSYKTLWQRTEHLRYPTGENINDPDRLSALRGSAERETGGFGGSEIHLDMSGMRNIVNNHNDVDELIEKLCGAFSEAAFSMAEGVHY